MLATPSAPIRKASIMLSLLVAAAAFNAPMGSSLAAPASRVSVTMNEVPFWEREDWQAQQAGVPVKAIDFMWWVYIRASDNVVTPWFKQYLREQLAQFTLYAEDLIAISLPEPKPKLPYFASVPPSAPHFYKEYGPDYKERYQWRVPPTTAAYTVKPEDLVKGV